MGNQWTQSLHNGFRGASVGIIMANNGTPDRVVASMFLVDLPDPAIKLERVLDTTDSSMPGGHAVVTGENLRIPNERVLGEVNEGF